MPQCLAAFLGLLVLVLNLACGQQQPDSPLLSSRSYITDGQPAAVLAPNTALQGLPLGELPASSPEACSQQCLQDEECSWFNYCSSEVDGVGFEWGSCRCRRRRCRPRLLRRSSFLSSCSPVSLFSGRVPRL